MIRPFTSVILLVAVLLGGWALGVAVARRPLPAPLAVGLIALELLLIAHGLVAATSLLAGHHAGETATHLAYLGTSIAVLPIVLGRPDQLTRTRGPWRSALVALGCFTVFVIVVRMWATWQPVL